MRSAYYVVRLGTVSAAAEALGVHRATIIRHIDALETDLGHKVFYRHARGYTPTDVGKDLLRAAEAAEAKLEDFFGRTKGRSSSLSGDFIITSLDVAVPVVMPLLSAFRQRHSDISIRYLVSPRLFRLEYGESHIAIRAGVKPDDPDHVVQHFHRLEFALYASKSYVQRFGIPEDRKALRSHPFVEIERQDAKAGFQRWLDKWVPASNIVFRSSSPRVLLAAVADGMGIGFLPIPTAAPHRDLTVVMPYRRPWYIDCWLVTHVDAHRSPKVQAFLQTLKQARESAPN